MDYHDCRLLYICEEYRYVWPAPVVSTIAQGRRVLSDRQEVLNILNCMIC